MEVKIKQAIDPVCGMTVDPGSAKARVDYGGKTYYFCCTSCEKKFNAAPEQFLKPNPSRLVMSGVALQNSLPPAQSGLIGIASPRANASEIVKDPVCGMAVNSASAKYRTIQEGKE